MKIIELLKTKRNRIILSGFFVFWIQILVIYNYYFYTGWDASIVVGTALNIANGGTPTAADLAYFSRYPNNLFLVFLFSYLIRIGGYYSLIIFQCLLGVIAGILFFDLAEKHVPQYSILGYILFLCIVIGSPWFSIPYSDATALIFPILIIWIHENDRIDEVFSWVLIGMCALIAYKIKPQASITAIAMVLLDRKRKNIIGLVIGLLCALVLVNVAINSLGLQLDENKKFGISHYLMMGMNEETGGYYCENDVEFSTSFSSAGERNIACVRKAISRVMDMGVIGFLRHISSKLFNSLIDGTFSWGGEGTFYVQILEYKNSLLSPLIRSFYYNSLENYNIWKCFENGLWRAVVVLGIIGLFGKKTDFQSLVILSIVGILIYSILFETRARYLFVNVPIFILLALFGMQNIESAACSRFGRKSINEKT